MFVWLRFKNESSAFWPWQQKHRDIWIPFLWCLMQRGRWAGVFESFLSGMWCFCWVWTGDWGGSLCSKVVRKALFPSPQAIPSEETSFREGAHAQITGKNLQVGSQNLPCGESERSLAVIIIIDYNSRQHQSCSVNAMSLSICYCFAGNCHQACDWMQKDKTTHPFYLVSVTLEPFTNYVLASWVSAEKHKATTQNVWGYFSTTAHTDLKEISFCSLGKKRHKKY